MSFINKILIANRGEIACRVIRTAKRMGIETVAVYSDIDKDSLFVQMADKAYHIGPSPALQSYLNSEKIIEVALHSKVKAIHPGFGFLSENADFADQCEQNNLIFVGPPGDAIRKMGSKSQSKIIMTKANVPVVPGYHGENQEQAYLVQEAKKIGYPVLIKAVMGGGGKGMRIVNQEEDFIEALESAKRESAKAFKDDRVLVEKYIKVPRHIEVQIFGDKHGNYVHLFERDCSIQRRHQKVIEEAPSALPMALKQEIGEKAKDAARAVNYTNAGTVEFIFDLTTKQYFFMEMNTRLQVEHPITEMITGTDLVEWQLRVAAGEVLPKKQEEIKINGHAIEARIYSESPNNDFLPGNGRLLFYKEPKAVGIKMTPLFNLEGIVRLESGVRESDEISIFYDPMIAKLVVWGQTREQAMRTLALSLKNYRIVGLPNNIYFLKKILEQQEYQKLDYDTQFIEKNKNNLLALKSEFQVEDVAYGIALQLFIKQSTLKLAKSLMNFRSNHLLQNHHQVLVSSDSYTKKQTLDVDVTLHPNGRQDFTINDQKLTIQRIQLLYPNRYQIVTNQATVERDIFKKEHDIYIFDEDGDSILIEFKSEQIAEVIDKDQYQGEEFNIIRAPMPCTLTKVNVKVNDQVKKGQVLLIMEAMKMEHTIKANKDGVVKEIRYKEGQFVEPGSMILKIE